MENEKQTRWDAELNLTRQQTSEDRQEEDIGKGIGIWNRRIYIQQIGYIVYCFIADRRKSMIQLLEEETTWLQNARRRGDKKRWLWKRNSDFSLETWTYMGGIRTLVNILEVGSCWLLTIFMLRNGSWKSLLYWITLTCTIDQMSVNELRWEEALNDNWLDGQWQINELGEAVGVLKSSRD